MACTSPVYANYLLQQHHRRRQLECSKAFSGERRAQNGNGNGRLFMSGRGRRKERQKLEIRAGLPVVSSVPIVGPVLNFVINPTVLTAIYVFGAIRFLSGFSQTTYSDTFATRFGLAAMWPVLFLASKKFRDNFKKAVTS